MLQQAVQHAVGRTARYLRGGETYIWEGEWDVCLVLDGCRLDAFRAVADEYDWLPDAEAVGSIWSVGSMSPEWISRTFFDRPDEAQRAGYLSANPFTVKENYRPYPRLPVTEADVGHLDPALGEWVQDDPDLGISTVPPDALTDRTIDAWRRRDELDIDRLVVHYMQPHTPFLTRPQWFGDSRNLDAFGEPNRDDDNERDVWLRVRDGELSQSEVWGAYLDNLRWVLNSIETLRHNCDATVAITSDHGQGLGEWGVWSHPPDTHTPQVREVPMVKLRGRDTKMYSPSIDASSGGVDTGVDERLAALGYK